MTESERSHVDLDLLDALRAGEPVPARVTAHLAWCAPCRAELEALHQLAADLAHPSGRIEIPSDVDRGMRVLAAEHARRVRHHRSSWWRARGWATAAVAAIAVAAVLMRAPRPHSDTAPERVSVTVALDVDRDGRITVLDAFRVARQGGGDAEQVEAIMRAAVALRGRS
jgi:predicted anti-sigma-YlaC factor YlaD